MLKHFSVEKFHQGGRDDSVETGTEQQETAVNYVPQPRKIVGLKQFRTL